MPQPSPATSAATRRDDRPKISKKSREYKATQTKQMTPYVHTPHTQHTHHENITRQDWETRQAPSTGRCCVALYLAGTDLCTRSLLRLVFLLTLGGIGQSRTRRGLNRSACTILRIDATNKKNEHHFVRKYKDQFCIIIHINMFLYSRT